MSTTRSQPPSSGSSFPIAAAGDHLDGADLQTSIDTLRAMANSLDDLITDDLPIDEMQQIGRAQAQLRNDAAALVGCQIDMLQGEALVAAEQVNAAIRYADAAIREVSDVKTRLDRIAAVIGFIGAVTSGSGVAIVHSATALKSALG